MSNMSNTETDAKTSETSEGLLAGEELLSLVDLAKRLPKINGRRPVISTLWRWCLKGIGGVRLEHARRGRVIATSLQAVDRFSVHLATQLVANHQERMVGPRDFEGQRPQSVLTRERQIEAAKRRLKEAGI